MRPAFSVVTKEIRYLRNMNVRTTIPSIILILFLTTSAFAQNLFNLSIKNGLSNNYVSSIVQDNQGFIWIGTIDGLNRFDGYSVKTFRHEPNNSTTLDDNQINDIQLDSKGNIFVITERCINHMLPTGEFVRYNITEKMNTGYITIGLMDREDQLWLGTVTGDLLKFNTLTGDVKEIPIDKSVKYKDIRPFFIDDQENIWFQCDNKGLYQLNVNSGKLDWHFKKSLKDGTEINLYNCFYAYSKENEMNVFFSLNKKYNFHTKELVLYKQEADVIADIAKVKSDKLSENQHLNQLIHSEIENDYFIKSLNELFQTTKEKLTLSYQTIYIDNSGCAWIATQLSGVYKTNLFQKGFLKFNNFTRNEQLINELNVRNIAYDKKGYLWLATAQDGVMKINSANMQDYIFYMPDKLDRSTSISGKQFTSVIADKHDNIWIGGDGAVSMLDKNTNLFTRYRQDTKPALNLWSVRSLFQDSKDNIWVGFWGVAAKIDTNRNKIKHYYYYNRDTSDYFPGSNINCIAEDKNGDLWFASSGSFKGLVHYISAKDTFITVDVINKGVSVRTLLIDSNIFWLGTENQGLIKYDGESDKILGQYDVQNGLPNNNICGILKDDNSNLWLSTFNGLSKFNIAKESFRNYTIADGLHGHQFNYNSCTKIPGGFMIFGGVNGFTYFHPDSLKNNPFTPKVVLTDFKVFNKSVKVGDTINKKIILHQSINQTSSLELSYKEKIFSFGFSALHFAAPLKILYAYRMEGFEEEWNYVDFSQKFVSYSNLPAGKYTFRVKATNNDGIWCNPEDEVALSITISPPFWKTWWFISILSITILATLYLWYLQRTYRLRMQRIILEKKVKERTEEINRQKQELSYANEELSAQKEELAAQADILQESNILLKERSEELEAFSEELKAQGEELYDANEKLVQLNATKDKFFSIIAHDLRNPFQAIISSSNLLTDKKRELTDEKRAMFQMMVHESSKNAYKLLENLLEWARSQTGHVKYVPEQINLYQIALKVKQLLDIHANSKNISIVLELAENITAYADKNMTETILRNLASNAIKFTHMGGKVTFRAQKQNEYMVISVCDNGVGMSEEVIEQLFKIDANHTGKGTTGEVGTGLGLILCNDFAKKNKGHIKVKSKPGEGSTFNLWLPQTENQNYASEPKPETQNVPDEKLKVTGVQSIETLLTSDGEKYRVLVVDDNPNIRKSIISQLDHIFEVSEAENGLIGLELAKAEIPDIVVSDVMMPHMDGFEFCALLKEDERTNHIPVVLLTARVSDASKIKGLGTGADDYLTKPFNINVLIARIHNLLKSREKLKAHFSKVLVTFDKDTSGKEPEDPTKAFLKKLVDIIEENMANPELSVESLGEKVHMSRSALYRKLTSITDKNPGELIKTLRMKKAAQLLGKGTMQVSEVMLEVGYTHGPHFSESFKKMFGVLPSEYKK